MYDLFNFHGKLTCSEMHFFCHINFGSTARGLNNSLTNVTFSLIKEQGCEGTTSEVCGNSAAKVFPYNNHCCGLCDWSDSDSSCNLSHNEKVTFSL